MPNKKKTKLSVEIQEGYEPEPVKADPIEEARERIFCGHQNMHYTEGELKCTLEKGHHGDHSALLNNNWTSWSDAAGTPTHKHA